MAGIAAKRSRPRSVCVAARGVRAPDPPFRREWRMPYESEDQKPVASDGGEQSDNYTAGDFEAIVRENLDQARRENLDPAAIADLLDEIADQLRTEGWENV